MLKFFSKDIKRISDKPHPMQAIIDSEAGYRYPCPTNEQPDSYRRLSDVPYKKTLYWDDIK
jgi:hypothetical protein